MRRHVVDPMLASSPELLYQNTRSMSPHSVSADSPTWRVPRRFVLVADGVGLDLGVGPRVGVAMVLLSPPLVSVQYQL